MLFGCYCSRSPEPYELIVETQAGYLIVILPQNGSSFQDLDQRYDSAPKKIKNVAC